MTDNYNTKSKEDPQSAAILKAQAEKNGNLLAALTEGDGKDPSELRTDVPEADGKGKKSKSMTISDAYKAGKTLIEGMDYVVRLELNAPFCHHTILKRQKPPAVEGVNYPSSFQPLQPILDDDVQQIVSALNGAPEAVRELWGGSIDRRFSIDMERIAKSEMAREKERSNFTDHQALRLGRSFDPSGELTGAACVSDPESWIPARSWFDPKLKKVTFQDVFTIFPDAEREILKLLIGRACVGPTEQIPHGWTDKIEHGARMAGIVVGDPGIGKSTLFERSLLQALTFVGYTRGNFQDIGGRFGLADVALSDLAYKDDTTKETLKRLMSSEQAKTLISSGELNTEEKNQKDQNVRARTTLLLCANDWVPTDVYDLDQGITDRFKILQALSEPELERLQKGKAVKGVTKMSELSLSSGHTLNPGSHLNHLTKKLGVSREALLLWCCRIATDEFYRVAIGENNVPGKDLLKTRVRELTSKCRIQFHLDVTKTLVMAMIFCSYLRDPKWKMPSLTGKGTLGLALRDLYFVATDPSLKTTFDRMKTRWIETSRQPIHYFDGLRRVNVPTVKVAGEAVNEVWADNRSNKKAFAHILEKLELRDGFAMPSALSQWVGRWNTLRLQRADDLREEAIMFRELMTEEELKRCSDLKLAPDDNWINAPDYSPESAQEQRKFKQ